MADDIKTPLAQPAIENQQALVDNGMLSPETVNRFPQQPVIEPIVEEESEFVDNKDAMQDIGLVDEATVEVLPEQVEIAEPSTEQNQLDTQKANEIFPKDRMKNLTENNGMSTIQAKTFLLDEYKRKQAQIQQKDIENENAVKVELNLEKDDLLQQQQSLSQSIEDLKSIGQSSDDFQQELDNVNLRLSEINSALPAKDDLTISDEEVYQEEDEQEVKDSMIKDAASLVNLTDEAKAQQMQEIAANKAAGEVNKELVKEAQKEEDQVLKRLDKLEADIRSQFNISSDLPTENAAERFMNKHEGWGKIGAGIMMALAGAAAGGLGGKNVILSMMDQEIDLETKKKKFDKEQKLQYNNFLLDTVKQRLNRLSNITTDKNKKRQLNLMEQQIDLQKQEKLMQLQQLAQQNIQNQELIGELSSDEGVTKEQVIALSLNKETRELAKNAVYLADGKARFATSAGIAKKLTDEILPTTNSALRGIDELASLSNQLLGGSLDITGARAKAEALQQTLIGSLRLELFGPGVLTEAEQKIARKIVKSPATIFSLKEASLTSLKTLRDKLTYSTKQRLKIAGINVPKSETEKKLDDKLQRFKAAKKSSNKAIRESVKGLKESDIITEFIKEYGTLDIKEF